MWWWQVQVSNLGRLSRRFYTVQTTALTSIATGRRRIRATIANGQQRCAIGPLQIIESDNDRVADGGILDPLEQNLHQPQPGLLAVTCARLATGES